jgi:hypothetical protein
MGRHLFISRKNLFHVETLQTKHVKLVSQERSKALAPAVHGTPSKQPDLIWARREDKIQHKDAQTATRKIRQQENFRRTSLTAH